MEEATCPPFANSLKSRAPGLRVVSGAREAPVGERLQSPLRDRLVAHVFCRSGTDIIWAGRYVLQFAIVYKNVVFYISLFQKIAVPTYRGGRGINRASTELLQFLIGILETVQRTNVLQK